MSWRERGVGMDLEREKKKSLERLPKDVIMKKKKD